MRYIKLPLVQRTVTIPELDLIYPHTVLGILGIIMDKNRISQGEDATAPWSQFSS